MASAQGKTVTAGGSLTLTVNPSPQCGEFTFPGQCDFETPARLKVKSRRECRGRDVKISRVDATVHGVVTTPGTSQRRGTATTTLGGRYTALYPGIATNNPFYEPTGGTKMSFQAVAPRFRTSKINSAFGKVICKRLKSSVETVTVPMPPPPDS